MDIVQNNGLSWIITYEVTRRRTVGNVVQESTIDQIFCTDESLISKFQINQPLGKSDHVSIFIDLNLFQPDKNTVMTLIIFKENGPRWNLKSSLKCHIKINWEFYRVCSDMSVEKLWDEGHGKLLSITKQVPQVEPDKPGGIDTYNMPWIKSSLKRALRAKFKAWCTFDEFPTISNLNLALFKNQNLRIWKLKQS